VEKPLHNNNHDKSMNEAETIVNTHASGLYAVNESHHAYRLTQGILHISTAVSPLANNQNNTRNVFL